MRYWVYIKDKVEGPYTENELAALQGFTPETLICPEETQDGSQEWVKASSLFDFNAPAAAAPQAAAEQAPAASSQADPSVAQLLIEKIDNLTREIEGMKTKLDESIAASTAAQAAAAQAAAQAATVHSTPEENSIVEDAVITDTQSLITHAEEVVAQAGTEETQEKPLDFLNEIHIGDNTPSEESVANPGEEVVLRSALDSFYNAKPQTEEEKEITFQDLLSPVKQAAAAGAVAAGAAAAGAAIASAANKDEAEKAPENISEEKREEIINDITAPATQDDAVLQAIDEAEKAEKAENAEKVEKAEVPELAPIDQPAEKQSLDLTDQPQLNVQEQAAEPAAHQEEEPQLVVDEFAASAAAAQLTPMGPAVNAEESSQQEVLQTAQELVPGKELKDENSDGILSQKDLDEAFADRTPTEDFPMSQTQQSLPEGQGFYNPKDMTEVQLKEGSTYLISDFIPPAEAVKTSPTTPKSTDNISINKEDDTIEEMVPGAAVSAAGLATAGAAVAAAATLSGEDKKEKADEKQEEASSTEKPAPESDDKVGETADDLSVSKIVFDNTIKTKRGATMDIKTAPMVQEPANSDRLDLSDSDLDINTQHDLKAADFKQSGSSLTKIILGGLFAVIIVAVVYVMLAYLEIIPASFNIFKQKASAQETNPTTAEMLGDLPQENVEDIVSQMDPTVAVLNEVKALPLSNGQTLQQLIESRHPAAVSMIDWSITNAVEPDNYSVLVKVPPENPQSFKISYRFNYNALTHELEPTISDSRNLLDSIKTK